VCAGEDGVLIWWVELRGDIRIGIMSLDSIGDAIELCYFQGDNNYLLDVNDFCLGDDPLRTIGNLVVDTQQVQLAIPAEALETHFRSARAVTEAHINADCEPPGACLIFKIHHYRYSVFSGGRKIVEAK